MKPIETVYKGYRFRSRLEARWAVFFDAMSIKWEYEKEGFVLEDGTYYLPDFWLPKYKVWVEVKAEQFSEEERKKCELLARHHKPVILAIGIPEPKYYEKLVLDIRPKWDNVKKDLVFDEKGEVVDESVLNSYFTVFSIMVHDFLDQKDISALKMDDTLPTACIEAKQARFEHGERG